MCGMQLDRAAKFGAIAAAGIIFISLTSFWLTQSIQADAIREGDAVPSILLLWVGAIAVSLLFLFVVIGEYVDRILEAKGLHTADE